MNESTKTEMEIMKEIFINAKVVQPEINDYNSINNGFLYLLLLYKNVYKFNNALLFQRNYNEIITFINITK